MVSDMVAHSSAINEEGSKFSRRAPGGLVVRALPAALGTTGTGLAQEGKSGRCRTPGPPGAPPHSLPCPPVGGPSLHPTPRSLGYLSQLYQCQGAARVPSTPSPGLEAQGCAHQPPSSNNACTQRLNPSTNLPWTHPQTTNSAASLPTGCPQEKFSPREGRKAQTGSASMGKNLRAASKEAW